MSQELQETSTDTLYAFTTVYVGPPDIAVPYQFGWIDSERGRIFARVVGTPKLEGRGTLQWRDGEGWWFQCEP